MRIDDSQQIAQAYRQDVHETFDMSHRLRLTCLIMRNDLLRRQVLLVKVAVHPLKTAARNVIFDATLMTAPARNARNITPQHLKGIYRQAEVAEFTGDIITPGDHLAIDD
ncbi:hypothetical protein D3C78_1219510 [compost metagenome]